MKKLLVIGYWLLAVGFVQAQNVTSLTFARPNAVIMRGDSTNLVITLAGNYANQKLDFVVKSDKVPTGSRLTRKRNALAGGDSTEMTATYTSPNTTITVKLLSTDTQDFLSAKYYYDVSAEKVGSAGNYVTIISGEIAMRYDIGGPLNGSQLAADGIRYIPVEISQITDGEFVKRSGNDFISEALYSQAQITTYLNQKVNLADSTTKWITFKQLKDSLGNYYNKASIDFLFSGYYTQAQITTLLSGKRNLSDHDSLSALDEKNFSSLANKPTTIAGYGITDAYTQHEIDSLQNLKQAALNGTGFVKISGTMISYDNSTYLTTETDPTIYAWAKAATKPSYSYSEISGTPNLIDSVNWNTAYGWGNHASAGYYVGTSSTIRGLLSSTAAGLTYTNTTGAFSWTAGFTGLTDSMRTLWSGKQSYYANLSSIGALANASGWLKNNGSGTFSYSTPSRTDIGLGTMSLVDSVLFKALMASTYVPQTRTINGYDLSTNRSLAYSDLSASKINVGADSVIAGVGKFSSINPTNLTSGYFPYYNGTSLVNSGIQTNGTNIGIGGAPNGKFEVSGGAIINQQTSNTRAFDLWGHINSYYQFASSFWGIREGATNHEINIDVAGSGITPLTISQSGFVGVGYTSDPTSGNIIAWNGKAYGNGMATFTGGVTIPATNYGLILNNASSEATPFLSFSDQYNEYGWAFTQSDATGTLLINSRNGSGTWATKFSLTRANGGATFAGGGTFGEIVKIGSGTTENWYLNGYIPLRLGAAGSIASSNSGPNMLISTNAYVSNVDGGWKYSTTNTASNLWMDGASLTYRYAASGTANSAINWTNLFQIDNGGNATFAGNVSAVHGIFSGDIVGTSTLVGHYTGTEYDLYTQTNVPLKFGANNNIGFLVIDTGGTTSLNNLYPNADNAYYLGKNSATTPFAWKGVILKDTTNGNYYRVEVINGTITATAL